MSIVEQNLYCSYCNKLIPLKCEYKNTNVISVYSDVDVEFELKAHVRCPSCGFKTSIILEPELTDIILLLNKYGYKTNYSYIPRGKMYSILPYIKFDKSVKLTRKMIKNVPEPWSIVKRNDEYQIHRLNRICIDEYENKALLSDLIELEKFIYLYMIKRRIK